MIRREYAEDMAGIRQGYAEDMAGMNWGYGRNMAGTRRYTDHVISCDKDGGKSGNLAGTSYAGIAGNPPWIPQELWKSYALIGPFKEFSGNMLGFRQAFGGEKSHGNSTGI